jgi:flagellin FlaB
MYTKLMRAMTNLHHGERGMTGLETAIILIAFVTVAAVFGYAVLSAGLFSAERGKETIYAGLAEAKSNLELSGSVIGMSDNNTEYVRLILFTVKNAIAGSPIDMGPCDGTENATNKCVISLTTKNDYFNNVKWTVVGIGSDNNNRLLEQGEQFEVTINMEDLGDNKTLSDNLTFNDFFNIQVKPAIGSTITIQRTLPPALEKVMDLH